MRRMPPWSPPSDVISASADASVATYLDGIYLPFPSGLASDFGKLERIEVLKGPQGTLFGRNTTGGAVNIVTGKPGEELGGILSVGFGSFDARRVKAFVEGPLYFDALAASVSFVRNESDILYDPIDASVVRNFDPSLNTGIHPRLRWQVTDAIDLTLSAAITRLDGPGPLLGTRAEVSGLLAAFDPAPQGDYEISREEGRTSMPCTITFPRDAASTRRLDSTSAPTPPPVRRCRPGTSVATASSRRPAGAATWAWVSFFPFPVAGRTWGSSAPPIRDSSSMPRTRRGNRRTPSSHAHAGYLYEPWGLSLSVVGRNLTDEAWFRYKLKDDYGTVHQFAPPRTFGVTLAWEF